MTFRFINRDKYERAKSAVEGTGNWPGGAVELAALSRAKKALGKETDNDALVRQTYIELGGAIVDEPDTYQGVPPNIVQEVREDLEKAEALEEEKRKPKRKPKRKTTTRKKAKRA